MMRPMGDQTHDVYEPRNNEASTRLSDQMR